MLDLFPGIITSPVQAASLCRTCLPLTALGTENKNTLSLKKNVFIMNCIIKCIMYLQISMRERERERSYTRSRSYNSTIMKLRAEVFISYRKHC